MPQCRHCSATLKAKNVKICHGCGKPRPWLEPTVKASSGPPCIHCSANLLSSSATVCDKCGRGQRRSRSSSYAGTGHIVQDPMGTADGHKKPIQELVAPSHIGEPSRQLTVPTITSTGRDNTLPLNNPLHQQNNQSALSASLPTPVDHSTLSTSIQTQDGQELQNWGRHPSTSIHYNQVGCPQYVSFSRESSVDHEFVHQTQKQIVNPPISSQPKLLHSQVSL